MKKIFALGLVCLSVAAWTARADIIPTYQGATPSGGNSIITYTINIPAEVNLESGDFFTIYDFGNIIPSSNTQPADWTFSTNLIGQNPAQTAAPDNASILNLTWTYTGPTITGASPAPPQNIGPFTVTIPGASLDVPLPTQRGFFAGQSTKAQDPTGSKSNNVGMVAVPIAVPEPSTLALILGAGGLGVFGRAVSRRRS
jgi:PEP-CTERM motif